MRTARYLGPRFRVGGVKALEDLEPGQFDWLDVSAVFVFIGRDPNSGWHEGSGVPGNDKGFTVTVRALGRVRREKADFNDRDPALRETRVAGAFAAGDVRLDRTEQVVSVAGEGGAVTLLVRESLRHV